MTIWCQSQNDPVQQSSCNGNRQAFLLSILTGVLAHCYLISSIRCHQPHFCPYPANSSSLSPLHLNHSPYLFKPLSRSIQTKEEEENSHLINRLLTYPCKYKSIPSPSSPNLPTNPNMGSTTGHGSAPPSALKLTCNNGTAFRMPWIVS